MNLSNRVLLFLCLALLAVSAFAQSQAGLGSISGTVQDPSGAVIPGAKVTVANESKGIIRSLVSNEQGLFLAPSLPPATGYSVVVEAAGFGRYERKEIEVLVGQQVNLPIAVALEAAAQTVEVSAGAPIVETNKQGVSQVVTTKQIDNLPINGRRVDSFVLLTPGVTNDGTFGLVSFRGVSGGNSFLTDGNDTTNQFYNENAGRTRITTQISQDAVQEFQVLSNGYSAEFGRAIGGVINTVTRSGTNDVHGTGYWFFRNRSLNARDRYSFVTGPGGLEPYNAPESRHQGGGSIAGPIVKNKLFYFFNGEVTRRDFPGLNRLINTAYTDTLGNFNGACSAPATPEQCQAAQTYLMRGNNALIPRTANSELLFGKLDYQLNEKNTISASFNYLRWISPNGIQTQTVLTNNNLLSNNANSTVRTRYGRLAWTSIPSNTVVNEARFGWFKDRLFDDFNPDFVPDATGRLYVEVAGTPVGVARDYPRLNPSEQRFQFADTVSWALGRHQLKIGGDVMSTQDYLNILRNQFGTYSYGSFSAFAADFTGNTLSARRYNTFSQTFGNPLLDFSTRDYAFFVQDQFRVTPSFTLNFGVRYEYTDLPTPSQVNADYPQTGRIPEPKNNWAPRVGLAYSLGDKTVIRSGFGMFYSRFQGALIQSLFLNNGLYQPQISLRPVDAGAPVFPNALSSLSSLPTGAVSLSFADENFRNPYTLQGDIAIERQLAHNLGLTVSYVYSRGVQFFMVRDLNIGPQGAPVTYRILDASGNETGTYTTATYRSANRIDKRYQRISQVENGGQNWYNGLVVQLNKRFSRGVQASVAYTWSHAIEKYVTGGGSGALFYDTVGTVWNGDITNEKGSSSLDQRHRLVASWVWSPTFTQSTDAWARYLVNGWQLSGIFTGASAQPATSTLRISGAPFSGAAFNGSLNGLGGWSRVPWLPINNLDIDQVYRVDARLARELPFSERVKAYLQFEAFNVFNHVSDTAVNTEAFSVSNGVIRPTAGLGVGRQSQGFPDGTNARRAQVGVRLMF
jgi:outer membrane receptor protein involved in Fe transport